MSASKLISEFAVTQVSVISNFARKVRIFNKSRYSRNRQNVRVTFYFAIYFNILIIFTIYGAFYGVIFSLTYNWWFYGLLLTSMVYPFALRVIKK